MTAQIMKTSNFLWLFQVTLLIAKSVICIENGAYLAINSLGFSDENENIIRRRLELNWYEIDPAMNGNVQVALFNRRPSNLSMDGLITAIDPFQYPDGFYITDIQLPVVINAEVGYQSQCVFPYWIQLQTNFFEQITEPRCIQSQPRWMSDHRNQIGGVAMGDLMMVATHDAASYRQYQANLVDNVAYAFVFTQEEDLELQLQYGARFLDIRIGYYPNTAEKFWLVHGVAPERPLSQGLTLVRNFLFSSKDVVIWDSHSFEQNWDEAAHTEYKQILREAFGRWWVAPDPTLNWNVTLNEIWNDPNLPSEEGRIIHIYQSSREEPDLYFPDFPEMWGNKDEPAELKAYLDEKTEEARNDPASHRPWRPNCQMTPTVTDAFFKYSDLREMADLVNRNVTLWWRTDYRDLRNVYTLHDFFMGTDMVRVAIDRNLEYAFYNKLN